LKHFHAVLDVENSSSSSYISRIRLENDKRFTWRALIHQLTGGLMTMMTIERPNTRSQSMDNILYRPNAVILYPGRANSIYRVKSGLVRLHTMDDDGNSLTLRYVKPGEFFGEEALAGLERAHFAESVTESVVEMFDSKLVTPEIAMSLNAHLAAALNRAYVQISRLALKRLRSRMAAALLELSDTAVGSKSPEGLYQVFATHDELAAAVGSVRETVTKVIGELAKDSLIDSGYGKITLRNLDGLRNVALE
jgi:CRP/FNR family transcriptional regulator, cyclic AMP receptor protein